MPKKKAKSGKSKKGGKKKGKSSGKEGSKLTKADPMAPLFVEPAPRPGERLVELLKKNPVDDKEIHGYKVTSRILKQLTPQEIRDLLMVFELFDNNSDGYHGSSELRRAMRALGFKCSREEAKQMISDTSLKGKHMIDFPEFLEAVIDRQGDARDMYDEILKGFNMFDYNKTGAISLEGLKMACEDAGIKFTQKELEEMIEEADLNGDGKVDQSEFIRIMLQTNLF